MRKPKFGDIYRWDNSPHNYYVIYLAPTPAGETHWFGFQVTENGGDPLRLTAFDDPRVQQFLDMKTKVSPGPGWVYVESLS